MSPYFVPMIRYFVSPRSEPEGQTEQARARRSRIEDAFYEQYDSYTIIARIGDMLPSLVEPPRLPRRPRLREKTP